MIDKEDKSNDNFEENDEVKFLSRKAIYSINLIDKKEILQRVANKLGRDFDTVKKVISFVEHDITTSLEKGLIDGKGYNLPSIGNLYWNRKKLKVKENRNNVNI
jgi:nucleoid DNA-binding protein